jgi:hypothetical protein
MPETLKYDFYAQIDGESVQGLRIGIHKCFLFSFAKFIVERALSKA